MLKQFPDPGIFMHRLNDQVRRSAVDSSVVGIQAHGGDSDLSNLLKSLLSFERGTESWSS